MTAVEFLAERYNYITWMRNRDEISAGTADEWRAEFLKQAKQMEKEQMAGAIQFDRAAPIKITLHEYSHHCADGCCHNYGTITKVNGVELPCHDQDLKTILTQLLEHLGYKVEIECTYDID